jgi:hypothetical protein
LTIAAGFHLAKVGSICFLLALGKPLFVSAPDNGLVDVHGDTFSCWEYLLPENATDMNTE